MQRAVVTHCAINFVCLWCCVNRWYQRVFRKAQPKPPAPRKRCRTSCSKCRMQYCVACKQAWHEGDCKPITDAIKKEEKVKTVVLQQLHVP